MKKVLSIGFIISLTFGCHKFVDVENSGNGDFILATEKEYNQFEFNSNIAKKRDEEIVYPMKFKLSLPKGIKYYDFIDMRSFYFFYESGQVIFIDTRKNFIEIPEGDIEYNYLRSIIEDLPINSGKYDVRKIKRKSNRQNFLINISGCQILLYNVKEETIESWKKLVSDFRVLEGK